VPALSAPRRVRYTIVMLGEGTRGTGPLIRDAVRNLVVNGLVAFGMIDSQLSGLRDQLVHALEHAEADRAKAGDDSLDNAHRVVEPLVALIIGLEPHHDVLSSHALPFRVLAEDRPPLHEKGDLCPVLRRYKTPGVGQHASVAPSSRMVRPLDGARKPGAFGASIPVSVTRSLFPAVWLYEREATLITELHVADGLEAHLMPPLPAFVGYERNALLSHVSSRETLPLGRLAPSARDSGENLYDELGARGGCRRLRRHELVR